MPESKVDEDGNVFAGDRRIARADSALPDWHIPDASYRPVPIVWFTGAFLLQLLGLVLLAVPMALVGASALIHTAFAIVLTGVIGFRCWERGMARASLGWRIATILMLLIQLSFAAMVILT